MKKYFALVVALAAVSALTHAGGKNEWDGSYKSFKGQYLVYSGELGEKGAPTLKDRKAGFMIEGPLAKEMFDAIGPDLKEACGASSTMRIREKGDLDCTHDKETPASPYTCHFGFNLRTGKSIGGSIC